MLLLSQMDARWRELKIGDSPFTIKKYGCTITGLSMLSHYFGEFLWPYEIAKKPWFDDQGRILWDKIDFKKFKFVRRWYGADEKVIADAIRDPKKACLIEVNLSHWLAGMGNVLFDFTAADPINGKKCWVKHKYGKITGIATFSLK